MDNQYQIRESQRAQRHLLQGLLLSRCAPLAPHRVEQAIGWAREVAADGHPLPPLGFVLDVGVIALGLLRTHDQRQLDPVAGVDPTLLRQYEDYVLGKLFADISFERASEGLLRYRMADQGRALAYAINQQRQRCQFRGVVLPPSVLKRLNDSSGEELIASAWQSVTDEGIQPELIDDLTSLITTIRSTGELLGPEDIFEIESGTALAQFGQRLALRQALQTSNRLQQDLPTQRPRSKPKQYSVATNIMEEDSYPIGGFTSISNRGTIESLVRSELAYIDEQLRPDLFDIKFARNELLYYSRDENQFLRRRLSYVIVLDPDLQSARIKDSGMPVQRIVMLVAMLFAMVNQLIDWLTEDAIQFDFIFVDQATFPLENERELIETLFGEAIKSGIVNIFRMEPDDIRSHCDDLARRSLCQSLTAGINPKPIVGEGPMVSYLVLKDETPELMLGGEPVPLAEDVGIEAWRQQLDQLLRHWV